MREKDADFVTQLLARYHEDCHPTGEVTPLGSAGGLSGARLWRFSSRRGTLLIRQWPTEIDTHHLQRVHEWLSLARYLPFVPSPIAGRDRATFYILDTCCYQLEPWLPGAASLDEPAREQVSAAMRGLAALHAALSARVVVGPSPGIAERARECAEFARHEGRVLHELLERAGAGTERELAAQCLDEVARRVEQVHTELAAVADRELTLQPCLRDCRPEHFLFEGSRLTAIVDYGAMGIESPAADLARLLGEWIGGNAWLRRLAFEEYAQVRALDEATSALVPVFERSTKLLAPLRWIRWHFLEQRVFEDKQAVARALRRCVARLREWS
jgi:homoserine kinase type II